MEKKIKVCPLNDEGFYGINIGCRSILTSDSILQPDKLNFDYYLFHGQPLLPKFWKLNKPMIFHFMWEFETLHPLWAGYLNSDKIAVILVNTQWLANVLIKNGINKDKIILVPYNISAVVDLTPAKIQWDKKQYKKLFTFGTLHWRKGVKEAVEALKQSNDKDFIFYIYSSEFKGHYKLWLDFINEINTAINEDKRFVFEYRHYFDSSFIKNLMLTSYAGVFTANAEGLSLVPIETIFQNTLVILSDIPVYKELYTDYPFIVKSAKIISYTNEFYNYYLHYPYHIIDYSDFVDKYYKLISLSQKEYEYYLRSLQEKVINYSKNAIKILNEKLECLLKK